ncbi:MAG: transposase [Phycisphaerae bacterium]|jgi:transposase
MRPEGTAEELERRRRRAIALLNEGKGVREAARTVGVAPGPVTRWLEARRRWGGQAMRSKPHPGRPRKLSARDRRRLAKLLLQGPRAQCCSTELWTPRRVGEVIEKHFGVHDHDGHVWRVLGGMGWSSPKYEQRAREGNGRPSRGGAGSSGRA